MKLVFDKKRDKKNPPNFSLYNWLMIIDAWGENYFITCVCIYKFTFKNKWISERFLAVLFK